MITFFLILLPVLGALLAWPLKKKQPILLLLLTGCAALHTILTALLYWTHTAEILEQAAPDFLSRWIGIDGALPRIFLTVTSLLFLAAAVHSAMWLPAEKRVQHARHEPLLGSHIYVSCLLAFLATMTLVVSSKNFGLMWVAVEATTLASAPLILFHRSGHSLEAMWKYLLICSVGIGLALFGTMLLAVAGQSSHAGLDLKTLSAGKLNPMWFKAAFIFILAGYGTKMGLAPFHTWLPDAHSEAPGTVSALLSGALLNCSFFAIARYMEIAPDTLRPFCGRMLLALGMLSLTAAAFFIVRQTDYKRMLAYSSVEHMGLIAIMWGLNLKGLAILHVCFHSALKMTLFLIAGNLLLACGTRRISDLGGLFGRVPRNAFLWLTAGLLICGVPPSPLFVTEYLMIRFGSQTLWLSAAILILLFTVFTGMTLAMLKMSMGTDGKTIPQESDSRAAERLCLIPTAAVVFAMTAGSILLYRLFRAIDSVQL